MADTSDNTLPADELPVPTKPLRVQTPELREQAQALREQAQHLRDRSNQVHLEAWWKKARLQPADFPGPQRPEGKGNK